MINFLLFAVVLAAALALGSLIITMALGSIVVLFSIVQKSIQWIWDKIRGK